MRFIYRRGNGARRRVMHLCGYNAATGKPTMVPLCGIKQEFNTSCNLPLGQRICKRCKAVAEGPLADHATKVAGVRSDEQ